MRRDARRPSRGKPSPDPIAACRHPDCRCGLSRRQLLKIAGTGAIASILPGPPALMAESPQTPDAAGHTVPADKRLSEEWLRRLFERGTPQVFAGNDLATIGMPVGGIGAGQLYLLGDGTLGCWQIFNRQHFTGYGDRSYGHRVPEKPVAQGFALVIETEGRRQVRRLSMEGFPEARFRGEYPIGRVDYAHPDCPVRVRMEAFSPFIPLNAEDSGLPVTLFELELTNTSDRPLHVGILTWLENAVGLHSGEFFEDRGLRRSRRTTDGDRSFILHAVEERPEQDVAPPRPPIVLADFEGDSYGDWTAEGPALGSGPAQGGFPEQNALSGYEGRGLVNTWQGNDDLTGTLTSPPFEINRRFLNFKIGGGNHPGEACVDLLIDDQVVRSETGRGSEELAWRSWGLTRWTGRQARIRIVDRRTGPWGHINVDHIELSDTARAGVEGPLGEQGDIGTMCLAWEGRMRSTAETAGLLADLGPTDPPLTAEDDVSAPLGRRYAVAAATAPVEIGPGTSVTHAFVLAWHFPNRVTLGRRVGQAYARRFVDARSAARYVLDHRPRLAGQTRRWRDTYYDSTLPFWLLDRLHSTVANLATGTAEWWANGRFWGWEGVFCCEGTCTHVWNYAQALARLFPALERSVREMQDFDEAFHGDGLVGFRGQRNGWYAADGQAGTILKSWREHLMSADDGFLRRNWPRIRLAIEYLLAQDGDDNGLMEGRQHNTFDINFEGPNTFVGSLYLAALRAGRAMALEAGDETFARRLEEVFDRGRRLSVEQLWNSAYFIQQVDLARHPKHQYADGCLSDQLIGAGWARQVGLGEIYPPEHTRTALRSIWTYNWAPDVGPHNKAHPPSRWFLAPGDAGLFNCTWPRGEHLADGVLYQNEVWTGTEYQVAGHMIWEGMVTEGLAICRAIHDRYHPSRHNPFNEVECGDHYARSLASWGILLALSGFEYHGPAGRLAFAPRISPERFKAAFTTAEGWGSFGQKRSDGRQTARIELHWGRLRLARLDLEVEESRPVASVAVTLAGRRLQAEWRLDGRRLEISFVPPAVVEVDQAMEVEIA